MLALFSLRSLSANWAPPSFGITNLFNTQCLQHIFTLVKFWVGKYNSNSFTFIQNKVVHPCNGQLLDRIIDLILDRFDQFLPKLEQISFITKPFALQVPDLLLHVE